MPDRRFPRAARLLTPADFKRVFAACERSADDYFTVLAAAGKTGPGRLGLAISKKHVRRAHQRNRLKRLSREVFRHHRGGLDGIDVVIMARTTAVLADNARLRESLARHLNTLCSAMRRSGVD